MKCKSDNSYYALRQRCNNKNCFCYIYYGGRGIKASISKEEVRNLWNRDNAEKMKNPSIDRVDPNKDYTYKNCRFIELSENVKRAATGSKRLLGKKLSKKTKDKIRLARTGTKHTQESIEKMQKRHLGILHSEETKLKISLGNKNKIRTPEQKKRYSIAAKKRWAKRSQATKL
jgi:hypothetical protein